MQGTEQQPEDRFLEVYGKADHLKIGTTIEQTAKTILLTNDSLMRVLAHPFHAKHALHTFDLGMHSGVTGIGSFGCGCWCR